MSLDDLISETRRLLQSLEDAKSEYERSFTKKAKRWNAATPRSTSTISSTQPTINDRTYRKSLSAIVTKANAIVTNANALLEGLPSELTAAAHTQPDGDTQEPLNPSEPSPLVPTLLHNEAQVRSDQSEAEQLDVRSQSPTTSLSSANSDIITDFIAGFGDTLDQRKADDIENRQEGAVVGDEGCRDGGSYDGAAIMNRGDQSRDSTPTHACVQEAVGAVSFTMSQMQDAMVTHLETLATANPDRCYDKIQVADFAPPDFSQVQPPASGYTRGSKFTKDKCKVTAHTTRAGYAFPPASTLRQPHQRPSLDEISSYFQRVFDSPPSECLPYFVGPIPMPSDYVPFVDAGPRLRRRNHGNIPGVNTPFWYISQCEKTLSTLHFEDGGLCSVNLLLAGAPKVYIIIPAYEKDNLEARIEELYGPGLACSQKVRHRDALISPGLLDEWGITYYLDCALPGEMIVTRPNTYHLVLNMGPNVAESVNIEFSDTPDMPQNYVWCVRGSEACGPHVITAPDFALQSSATTSNMKRTRASLAAPKLKKPRTVLRPIQPEADLAYGHLTYTQVYEKFSRDVEDKTTIEFLTRLFFAIGSPEAMSQLLRTCHLRRDGNTNHLFPPGETVGEAMEALDKVDEVVSGCSIVRRYHLLSLVRRRTCLVQEQKLVLSKERTRNGRVQRAETLALDKLYQEVYGAAAAEQPSEELRTKLKNRLRHGCNWSSLVDRFSIGILAVVPIGKHTGLTNPQIELVREQTFQLFLTILDQERGGFLRTISDSLNNIYRDVLLNPKPAQSYVFEGMDQNALAKTPFDSETLLGYCANVNA